MNEYLSTLLVFVSVFYVVSKIVDKFPYGTFVFNHALKIVFGSAIAAGYFWYQHLI